jgi:hypothetical protein
MSDSGLAVPGMTELPRRYDVTITVDRDCGHHPNPARVRRGGPSRRHQPVCCIALIRVDRIFLALAQDGNYGWRTMNGPDHYREAERLLEEAQSHEEPDSSAL